MIQANQQGLDELTETTFLDLSSDVRDQSLEQAHTEISDYIGKESNDLTPIGIAQKSASLLAGSEGSGRSRRYLHAIIQQSMVIVKKDNEELQKLAVHDNMTGSYNRNHLDTQLPKYVKEASRQEEDLNNRSNNIFYLVKFDVIDLKSINTLLGEPAVDKIIGKVHELTRKSIRESDEVYRLGGDEYVMILKGTTYYGALLATQKVQNAIKTHFGNKYERQGQRVNGTISGVQVRAGVVPYMREEIDGSPEQVSRKAKQYADRLLQRADDATKVAKDFDGPIGIYGSSRPITFVPEITMSTQSTRKRYAS